LLTKSDYVVSIFSRRFLSIGLDNLVQKLIFVLSLLVSWSLFCKQCSASDHFFNLNLKINPAQKIYKQKIGLKVNSVQYIMNCSTIQTKIQNVQKILVTEICINQCFHLIAIDCLRKKMSIHWHALSMCPANDFLSAIALSFWSFEYSISTSLICGCFSCLEKVHMHI
jgi:hypothetical protein